MKNIHTISVIEFKRNFEKYNEIAQKECIQVTSHGQVIYGLIPSSEMSKYKVRILREKCAKNIPFDDWKQEISNWSINWNLIEIY